MANKIHLRQVEKALLRDYRDRLDLTDVATASTEQREKVLRTRALAAEAMRHASRLTVEEAAESVTDGTGDNGIDALYVDLSRAELTLVQSKWHESGTGTISVGDTHAFIQGFKDLTDENFTRFNPKIQALESQVLEALNLADLTIQMIVVTSGGQEPAPEVRSLIDDLLVEMNHDGAMLAAEVWGLEYLRTRLAQESGGARVDLKNVVIENYGSLSEPFQAYYGVIEGSRLRGWYEEHGDSLFSQNIRKSLGSTGVNDSLRNTVSDDPDNFWYYNNGVTVLADKIERLPRGAASRNYGEFDLEGASVVSGAQTVASLAAAMDTGESAENGPRVWIRVIPLEGCPPDFAADVTRATNTQNTVESRDFVSLDDEQVRLRADFRLSLGKVYSIKRGEPEPEPSDGCTVTEATIALACMQPDIPLAVIAKSAPGRLWDMQGRYYQQLFNGGTQAFTVWRAVQTMRWVDQELDSRHSGLPDGRPRAVADQGRRVILWAVFRNFVDMAMISDPDTNWDTHRAAIRSLAGTMYSRLYSEVENQYSANYVTSLFKNAGRCRTLTEALDGA